MDTLTEVALNKGSDSLSEYAVGLRRYVTDIALNYSSNLEHIS